MKDKKERKKDNIEVRSREAEEFCDISVKRFRKLLGDDADAEEREWVVSFLRTYIGTGLMTQDFIDVTPEKRLAFCEKALGYILPKIKSVEMSAMVKENPFAAAEHLRRYLKEAGGVTREVRN